MLRRRMLIMLGVVLLIVLLLAGYKAFSIYQQIQVFSKPKPPVSVAVATAVEQPWQQRLPSVGTLKALQGVNLSLEIAETVKALQFESGQKVRVGQPLLQMDSDVEKALLGTAEADLGLAQVEYGRGSRLVGDQAISKGDFDKLAAQFKKASATVAQCSAAAGPCPAISQPGWNAYPKPASRNRSSTGPNRSPRMNGKNPVKS